MQTQFQTDPFALNVCIGSAGHFECEKTEENEGAKEYGEKVHLKMDR